MKRLNKIHILSAILIIVLAIAAFSQTNSIGTAGGSGFQVQYNNSTGLAGISNGSAGQVMTSQGASAAPAFANPGVDLVVQDTTAGAIPIAAGTHSLGSTGALAMTLAAPTAGGPGTGQDGTRIFIVAVTAHAHTVTTPASGINGSLHIVTFAAVDDCVELEAVNGVWYVRTLKGATLS